MNAVATIEPAPQATEGATLLSVISRAASDPNVDIEKMERLMAMHERMIAQQAVVAFNESLSDMQDKLPSVGERGNAAGRYTYALWEDINAAIKPILKEHGFALSFRTDFADGVAVTGVLSHRGGHSEATTIRLPADPSGNKNAVQAVASSVSYGKRYAASALLNLTSHGEDDDAFASSRPDPAGDPKYADWRASIEGCVTKAELADAWKAMPKDAQKALARIKDEQKEKVSA